MQHLIDTLSTAVPAALVEVRTLGRTLKNRAGDILAYFDRPGTSNLGVLVGAGARLRGCRVAVAGVAVGDAALPAGVAGGPDDDCALHAGADEKGSSGEGSLGLVAHAGGWLGGAGAAAGLVVGRPAGHGRRADDVGRRRDSAGGLVQCFAWSAYRVRGLVGNGRVLFRRVDRAVGGCA